MSGVFDDLRGQTITADQLDELVNGGAVERIGPPAANTSRLGFVASAQRLKLGTKTARKEILRPTARGWQATAWDYYDEIGEIKFAFNLKASIMSRVRLYPGIIVDRSEAPVEVTEWLKNFSERGLETETATAFTEASIASLDDLDAGVLGGLPELVRSASLNFDVAGEMFLLAPSARRYVLASTSELTVQGDTYSLTQSADDRSGGSATGKKLKKDIYAARIWRKHPRWSKDPDSSMRGVLDQCEKLVLLDRVVRTTARSALPAGAVFMPDGIHVSTSDDDEEMSLEEVIYDAWTAPMSDEAAGTTIVPLILRGPIELGEKIKRLELVRLFDPELAAAADRALERLLAGIDVPKDMVSGLSDTKYSNAIIIDDGLYKAHIEPGALGICDAFTTVYHRVKLRQAGFPEELVRRAVIWYDPSDIVTRPDKSSAANEGFDKMVLSAEAWRRTRGFPESDAPSNEELLARVAFNNTQLPQDTSLALLEHFVPETFTAMRQAGQAQTGMPESVTDLINPKKPPGETAAPAEQPDEVTPVPGEAPAGGVPAPVPFDDGRVT